MTKLLWKGCTYGIECHLCAFCTGSMSCIHPKHIKEKENAKKMGNKNVIKFEFASMPEGYKMSERGSIVMDFSIPRCRYCHHFYFNLGCIRHGNNSFEKIDNPEVVVDCEYYIIDDSKWPQTAKRVKAEKIMKEVNTTWERTKELEEKAKMKKAKIDAGFKVHTLEAKDDHYHDYHKGETFSTLSWNDDVVDALSSGIGFAMPCTETITDISGEKDMVIIDKDIKDKERQINKILETRKLFIKNFFESFEDLDKKVVEDHLFDWDVKVEFLNFLLTKVNKKNRKKAKKLFNKLRFYSVRIDFVLKGHSKDVTRLDGENWFVVKKLIAMIKKYGCIFINDVFQTRYSDLAANYDSLVFDDEKTICEACGTENENVAIYCNNCGKRF
ncbi:hypothetical protein KAR91_75585 [Candidatus Pacearchaeota archaeon]|nr:hypothetical protein [Candidatus Pacearchaeota archaeon]